MCVMRKRGDGLIGADEEEGDGVVSADEEVGMVW